jgi:tetratricopeptide (TPR) repeat protein
VRPDRLAEFGSGDFLAHEIVRPVFSIAQGLLREVPRLRPDHGSAIALADRSRDASDWRHAAHYYGKALARMPSLAAIWVQYGHALKESGDVAAAETAHRRSIELEPDTTPTAARPCSEAADRVIEASAAYLHALALKSAVLTKL